MRTTLTIDDDVLEAARVLAEEKNDTVGRVLSDLARKGLARESPTRTKRGIPIFVVSEKAKPFTPEAVRRALEDDDR